jgi:hypothetical protein
MIQWALSLTARQLQINGAYFAHRLLMEGLATFRLFVSADISDAATA